MSELVSLTRDGDVGVITVNNPPVNALSPGVPEGIVAAVEQISKRRCDQGDRPDRRRPDLHRRGRHQGVRQDHLGQEKGSRRSGPAARGDRRLPEAGGRRHPRHRVRRRAGDGDGLPLSRRRPGGPGRPAGGQAGPHPRRGGTQRLPRLAGVAKAAEMCAAASPSAPRSAWSSASSTGSSTATCCRARSPSREIAAGGRPPKTRDRNDKLGDPATNAAVFAAARAQVKKTSARPDRPAWPIDAVEAATSSPSPKAASARPSSSSECLFSDQSKALIHVFFGEREVAKIPGLPKDTPTLPRSAGRGRRRGHDGRRHRHGLRQRRHPRAPQGSRPGGARPRPGDDPQELRRLGEEGPLHPGRDGPAAGPDQADARPTTASRRPTSSSRRSSRAWR